MSTSQPQERVAIIGLGYVGLPLAAAFGRVRPTIGFDLSESRVGELQKGHDRNGDVTSEELQSPGLEITSDPAVLAQADIFIVAVPTPVDASKRPDLSALRGASRTIGVALAARAKETGRVVPVVVYESTVYPGCTEEDCVPVIEQASGLRASRDFKVGYSPERINPGDREHRLETIVKIVSGEDGPTLDRVAALYESVVKAGVYRAPDIRTAEAAKVIENTQRDLNIALMNELAMLFHKMGIDTQEVLKAAGTKWNFLPFKPGLVGGHCIPEDPYYLTHKAETLGFHPHIILAGRRINDGMGAYVAREAVKALAGQRLGAAGARFLLLGLTFKENVADVRNSRSADIARELQTFGARVDVHDPLALPRDAQHLEMGNASLVGPEALDRAFDDYDAIVLAVPHTSLCARLAGALGNAQSRCRIIVDVKGALEGPSVRRAGIGYWRL